MAAVLAASSVILAAIYLLWLYQRVFFGEVTNEANLKLKDLPLREIAVLTPLVVLSVWIGVYPAPLLDRMEPSVVRFLDSMEGTGKVVLIETWDIPVLTGGSVPYSDVDAGHDAEIACLGIDRTQLTV